MKYDILLIKYGELALKKRNRHMFEECLVANIRRQLAAFPEIKIERTYGRVFVHLHGRETNEVIKALQRVFGIVAISPVIRTDLDLTDIQEAAGSLMAHHNKPGCTFKVETRRPNKKFPHTSQEISRRVGGDVLRQSHHLKVDVHHPDVTLSIEVRSDDAYLYSESYDGLGGLPVGSSGKVMLMLSGGIDSPVAGFLSMKRGVELEAVHFHSYPYTSERARKKVEDLAQQLSQYSGRIKLHIVPFTEIQTQIRKYCPESYGITVMRRFMFRIAERLSLQNDALALATGESVGQVASQTLESMQVINEVVHLPVLRPLVSMDKQEIMNIAKQIDTYETSILPYDDCCTVFVPKSPQTRPKPDATRKAEKNLDVERLVNQAVDETEVMTMTPGSDTEFTSFFA